MAKKNNVYKEDFKVGRKFIFPIPATLATESIESLEEDRGFGFRSCCEPFLVLADLNDDVRYKNDITGAWAFGDSVTFRLRNVATQALTTYTPSSTEFPNETDCFYTQIEWRDVLSSDGVGCYQLEVVPIVAGLADTIYIWGEYDLMHFSITAGDYTYYTGKGTVRVLSEFNDVNDSVGINMTDARVKDSIRMKGKFGYWNDNTEVDNIEYLDGTMEKIRREDYTSYELRVSFTGYPIIERLRFHLLSHNGCWISDHNPDNYSYFYQDLPVILQEGYVPEHFDGTRKIRGVAKFEDKVRKKRTHFQDNRQTSEADPAPDVCLPVTVTDGESTVTVYSGGTYTCAGGASSESAMPLKTGQTTSYATNDDGDLEKGRDTNFTTLDWTNPFGDTNRFTDELGGQTYTNNIVIDWSSYDADAGEVLGWYRTSLGNNTWANALTAASGHSVGSFTTGWRLPNNNEWLTLFNYGAATNVFNYGPFTGLSRYNWSSTTYPFNTTYAFRTDSNIAVLQGNGILKTITNPTVPIRTFTLTELGL